MTLASKLMEIKKATGKDQERLSTEFSKHIEGHPEERTLRDCMVQAKLNRGFLDFGRNMFVPDTLKNEGFHMEMAGPGYHMHFD